MTGYVADLSWKSGARAIEKLDRVRSTLAVNVLRVLSNGWKSPGICAKCDRLWMMELNNDFTVIAEVLKFWFEVSKSVTCLDKIYSDLVVHFINPFEEENWTELYVKIQLVPWQ